MHRRDIVRIAQGAGLPEANGFDRKYIPNPQTWLVTYSDEFDFDFFLVRLVMQRALAAIEGEKATPNLLYWPAKRRAGTRAHTYLCGISDTGRCRRHRLSLFLFYTWFLLDLEKTSFLAEFCILRSALMQIFITRHPR